jgi:hypothetical protein
MEKKGRGRKLDGVTNAGKRPVAKTDELRGVRVFIGAGWGGAREGSSPWCEWWAQAASGAAVLRGAAGEQRGYRWADPLATVPLFGYSYIFKLIQIEMVKM